MKKLFIFITIIFSVFVFNSCSQIKEFKSLNTVELFTVYITTWRNITIYSEVTKQTERDRGIEVKPLNDSIVNKYNINRENAELEILHKNEVIKTKSIISKNEYGYLQFYLVGTDNEKINTKDSTSIVSIDTWADKYDLTLKIEVNGEIRIFKYVSE